MAEIVVVPGPCHVYVDTGSSHALEALGYSINGVEIAEEPFYLNVPGDQNGGDDGPPIDVQYLGEINRVRMELSKWDPSIAAKCLAKIYGGTAGVVGTPGTLMAANAFRLVLSSTLYPRNYKLAFLRNQIETQRGTKFARLVLEWECHGSSNTIYDTTVT